MRILHISSARNYGGSERHVVDLCRGLQERGHEVYIALRPTSKWQDRVSYLDAERFLHVSIRNSFGMFSSKRIGRFLAANKIDIIHAHLGRDYVAAAIASRISRDTRFVLTRHVMPPVKPYLRFALRNMDAAIGVSSPVADQLAKVFAKEKVRVIPNGLDVEDETRLVQQGLEFRTLHGIPRDTPLIGCMGELKPSKGQRDLVLAANEIAKTNSDCRFVIAGQDYTVDSRFRRELRRLVKVFGLEDRFVWLDWIEDTAPFFAAVDVFVSPSHSESFGLAILESMARGKAVVATNTDGARELLEGIGSLTPVGSPIELAAAIRELVADPAARTGMGRSLKNVAEAQFSVDQMVAATESLYAELLMRRK